MSGYPPAAMGQGMQAAMPGIQGAIGPMAAMPMQQVAKLTNGQNSLKAMQRVAIGLGCVLFLILFVHLIAKKANKKDK